MKSKVWGILIAGLTVPVTAYSHMNLVEVRGFGTLSGTYSDSDSLGYRPDLTKEGKAKKLSLKTDSLLGLQTDVYFSEAFKASVQIVGKDKVNDSIEESITLASLSYDVDNHWSIRAGRIGSDLTLIGDVGNIGYAYESVRPPSDFYGAIPFYYFDGLEILQRRSLDSGHLIAKAFYGRSGNTFKYNVTEHNFDLVPFMGAAVHYENGGFSYRAAYARTEVGSVNQSEMAQLETISFVPGIPETIDQVLGKHSPIDFYTTGIVYRYKSWKWFAEASYMDSDIATTLPSVSAYGALVKRFNDVALYSMLSHTQTIEPPQSANSKLPEPFYSDVQNVLNTADFKQTTASVGVRWDVASNVALKGQWDRIWVTANKDGLWDGGYTATGEQVNVFTLSMSFVF